MQKPLNEDFIEEYSEQFAATVCNTFFASRTHITGQQILSITPSKQVNFFVIKLLFNNWQDESKRLESPFFDYSSNEVKEAMLQFMNVLSRFIKVERMEFEILLQDAVRDTLFFIMSPNVYIEIEMDRKGTETLTEKSAKNIGKYLRIAKDEFSADLMSQVGRDRDDIELDESILTDDLIQNEISLLNEIVPLTLKKLEEGDEEDEFPLPEIDMDEEASGVHLDLDELETTSDEQDVEESENVNATNEEIEEEGEVDEDTQDVQLEDESAEDMVDNEDEEGEKVTDLMAEEENDAPDASTSIFSEDVDDQYEDEPEENNDEDEGDEDEISKNKPEIITNLDPDEEDEDDEDAILNTRFENPLVGSIAEKHEADADSMLSAISLNHRYMFINELFDGEADLFAAAIHQVDNSKSFDDAVELLMQNYAKDFHWDMNSDEVKELLKIIFRRFR